jgi:hypothetical protein
MNSKTKKPDVRDLRQLVADAQAFFTEGMEPGALVSEELIRERREEAERENRFQPSIPE